MNTCILKDFPQNVHKHVVASGYLHFDHSFEKSKMLLALLIKVALITTVVSDRLEPGEPGGPWTEEEISIVREKVCTA